MTDLATKLRLLIPRLGSDRDGEVLATVAAIRRALAAEGYDLHDLAAAVVLVPAPMPQLIELTPAEMAHACTMSCWQWKPSQADFLRNVTRFGTDWDALTPKQAEWLKTLHDRIANRPRAAA